MAAGFLSLLPWSPVAFAQDPYRPFVDPSCTRTLPPRAVQDVSGQTNVTLVPRDPRKGAHGTCNYAVDGTVVLMVAVNPLTNPTFYESYTRNCGYAEPPTPIPDLGDEALSCPAYGGAADNAVVVRRRALVVVLESVRTVDVRSHRLGPSVFTIDQLTELARTVMNRL